MVYSEEELVGLPVDDIDDTKVPDNQRDIRPSFHTSKSGATTLAEDDEESENENDFRKCTKLAEDGSRSRQ